MDTNHKLHTKFISGLKAKYGLLEDSLKEGGFLQKQIKKSKTYKKKDSKKNKTRKRRIY